MLALGSILAVTAVPICADAGWLLKIEQKCRALPFQADGVSSIEQYISPGYGLTILPDRTVILHLDRGLKYELDRPSKTYTRTNMKSGGSQPARKSESGADALADLMQGAIQTMAGPLRITPSNDYRQAVGYHSRRYDAANLAVTSQIWATTQIKDYQELMTFAQKAARLFESQPLVKSLNLGEVCRAIDGFPVFTTIWMLGGTMTFTLQSIEEQSLDPQFFEVPADYRLVRSPG